MLITAEPVVLVGGFTEVKTDLVRDRTILENQGFVDIVENNPFVTAVFTVGYERSEYEKIDKLRYDVVHNFWLNHGAGAFLFDNTKDNAHDSRKASGIVEEVNGVLRLTKHYPSPVTTDFYVKPITRPMSPDLVTALAAQGVARTAVTLGGGAAGGTLDFETGIVTGEGVEPGTWTGHHLWPVVFLGSLSYRVDASGGVTGFDVVLKEIREDWQEG